MGGGICLTLFFRQNVSPDLIKTDSMETRPDTPRPTMEPLIDLRTPSFFYNHGGYYAPGDPKTCNMPGGPCSTCQARIDEEEAAEALLALSKAAGLLLFPLSVSRSNLNPIHSDFMNPSAA